MNPLRLGHSEKSTLLGFGITAWLLADTLLIFELDVEDCLLAVIEGATLVGAGLIK